MPTDEIEVTSPSQPGTPSVLEPTTPTLFTNDFDDDPMTLFPMLNDRFIPFSSKYTSPDLPSIEELLESSSAPVLNQKNSPRPKRKAFVTQQSIENLGFDNVRKDISVREKKILELEAKRKNAALRKDRNECNRISAAISRDRKTISRLQDKQELKQCIKTISEKDKLIETLQNKVEQQAIMIKELKQQLENQPSKKRRKQH